jgi:hypothetical protein
VIWLISFGTFALAYAIGFVTGVWAQRERNLPTIPLARVVEPMQDWKPLDLPASKRRARLEVVR